MVKFVPPSPSKPKTEVVYFSSGTGLGELSNLCKVANPFEYKGRWFLTSEHAYMSDRVHSDDRNRFSVGGDLCDLTETSVELVFGTEDANVVAKKKKYWSAKGSRPSMAGIIAKMATKPERAKKLHIRLKSAWKEEDCTDEELCGKFVPILLAKYRANPAFCALLLGTQKKTLVEWSKSAIRDGSTSRWTGLVDKDTGLLHGGNLQGRIQMVVRRMLRKEKEERERAPENLV